MDCTKLIVDLSHAQAELEKAQRNNNAALMFNIADRTSQLANRLCAALEETMT